MSLHASPVPRSPLARCLRPPLQGSVGTNIGSTEESSSSGGYIGQPPPGAERG
jgi:hypothetical protein